MSLRRLDQLLASLGYGSRRDVRELVEEGRVSVAGSVAARFDVKVDPSAVLVDGAGLDAPDGLLAVFHKPVGYTCTHSADEGPTIYELLPPRWLARNPAATSIGRLDKDTSGLLLITDLGRLVQRFTSPKSEVEKVYEVTVDGCMSPEMAGVFAEGTLMLRGEDKPCLPARLEITGDHTGTITLHEGRYHQVRRMFASQGVTVTKLHRTRFGSYELGDLPEGAFRLELPPP